MSACTSRPLPLTPPRQNALLDAPGDGVGPTQPHASPVMGNVSDDDRWLQHAALQDDDNDMPSLIDDDNDSLCGEASDVNNLCNGECIVFHFVGVRLTFRLRCPYFVLPRMQTMFGSSPMTSCSRLWLSWTPLTAAASPSTTFPLRLGLRFRVC